MYQPQGRGSGDVHCTPSGLFPIILTQTTSKVPPPAPSSHEGHTVSLDRYLFTSESVSMGHPDKVADQISDAVLDFCLQTDPMSRVACETLVTTDLAVVAGEITTKSALTREAVDKLVREVIREIGYVAQTPEEREEI